MKLKKIILMLLGSIVACPVYPMERGINQPAIEQTIDSREIDQLIAQLNREESNVKENIYEQKDGQNNILKIDLVYFYNPLRLSSSKALSLDAFLYVNNKQIGRAEFSFWLPSKSGRLDRLTIFSSNARAQGYGSLLLACGVKKSFDLGFKNIAITASPFDLTENQSESKILPKLLTFYKQFGAEPNHALYKPLKSPANAHELMLTNTNKAREGIYTILEQWESKNTIQINNSPALQRAAAIVNHITPK